MNCYEFTDVFGNTACPDVELDEVSCETACNCSYLPFHKVVKHIDEIRSYCKERNKDHSIEFIVKEKIKHLSALFDKETYRERGYYSKAHFITKKVIQSDGTSFLEVGSAIEESLQVCLNGKWIKPEFYKYEKGFLKLNLCQAEENIIHCPSSCNHRVQIGWLNGCYIVTGKFGSCCADAVIEGAVLEQLLNDFRIIDPRKAVENQLYPTRPSFTAVWKETVGLYRADHISSFC